MGLIASLIERAGFSWSGTPVPKVPVAPQCRDYTPYELELIERELRSNNAAAEEVGKSRGLVVDKRIAAANLT